MKSILRLFTVSLMAVSFGLFPSLSFAQSDDGYRDEDRGTSSDSRLNSRDDDDDEDDASDSRDRSRDDDSRDSRSGRRSPSPTPTLTPSPSASPSASPSPSSSPTATPSPTPYNRPVISNIQALSSNDGTSLEITWLTDEASDSRVSYGTSANYSDMTPLDTNLVGNHLVTITGLSPRTTYHFSVMSNNGSGVIISSPDQTITTLGTGGGGGGGTTDPTISGISAQSSSDGTSLTITWLTDRPANSQVSYGTSSDYSISTPLDTNLVTNHSVTISGLAPNTTVHFAVLSSTGNVAVSSDQVVTTSSGGGGGTTTAPVISNISASSTENGTGATINWLTDQNANSQVLYGISTDYSASTTLDTSLSSIHSVTLSGLNPDTLYHFAVVSSNGAGLTATSADQTFTTSSGNGGGGGNGTSTNPMISNISAVSANNGTAASITWTTDLPASSQVSFGLTSDHTASTTLDSNQVIDHSVSILGLNPNTTYHFVVMSAAGTNSTVSSADQVFTTGSSNGGGGGEGGGGGGGNGTTTAPNISNLNASSTESGTGLVVTWTTSQSATSQVRYGTSSDYTASSTLNSNLTTSHSVALSGLSPNTAYHFSALSANSAGLTASSSDQVATTSTSTSSADIAELMSFLQKLQQFLNLIQQLANASP